MSTPILPETDEALRMLGDAEFISRWARCLDQLQKCIEVAAPDKITDSARSMVERKLKDANVSPRLEGAMRAFKANGQIRNKTLANFLDQKHFNACLSKAAEFGGEAEKKRLAAIKYCHETLIRFVRAGGRASGPEEAKLLRERADFLLSQKEALPDGFVMPEEKA